MKAPVSRAHLQFILTMAIYGSIGIFRRFIPLSSGMIAFVRGLLGGVFVLGIVKLRRRKVLQGFDRRTLFLLIAAGVMLGLNWVLLFEAYNHTTVAVATLCYYMQPTFLILLSPLVFKETLTPKKALCAVAAVVGMTLVSGVLSGESPGTSAGTGILCGLGAASLYTAIVVINKKLDVRNAYGQTVVELLSAAAVMVPYLLLTEDVTAVRFDPSVVLMLLTVGIVHTGIAYVLYFKSLEHLSTQTVAVLGYLDPVIALLLSWMILQEPMSLPQTAGAVMILLSAYLAERRPSERR